ncbi:MAG: tRNA dihydrouridine synthase DusB [Eubacteriales bacterium]|nr:tRNA dihydrouridine synthase DusB [Eubacteriales bacterium]
MITIGTLNLPSGAALAPMAGVTDHVMRLLCREYGAAWSVTEMINAQGYCCAPENAAAIERLLYHTPQEGILGVQLFGREPRYFAQAAAAMEQRGFAFIDLNMGCPARKVVSGGSGSALMQEPALCGEIVAAVKKAVSVPVTVKMRSGWDEQSINAPLIARIVEENGADLIAIHGRTRQQQYSGLADRSVMKAVREAVQVPVLANGDVRTWADAQATLQETGCAGVIVGRGACGNPWAFRHILQQRDEAVSTREKVEGAVRHLEMLVEWMGESWGVIESRKHIAWYLHGVRGAAAVRSRIMTMKTKNEVVSALNGIVEE